MNIILYIIGCGIIVAATLLYLKYKENEEYFSNKNNKFKVTLKKAILYQIIGVLIILIGNSFTIIPTGYTGVRTTFGMIDDVTVQNGFNWKIPIIQNINKVNNKQQDIQFEDKIWSETKSRTAIYYENIIVTYQINTERSAWIYANVSSYDNNLVTAEILHSGKRQRSDDRKAVHTHTTA